MLNGKTTYGYKFIKKTNCEKVGKDLVKVFKKSYYKCKIYKGEYGELNRKI
jgi:hypothetical protein